MLDVIKTVHIILISRLRAMFQAEFQKLCLSAEEQETGSEMWGMESGRLRKTDSETEKVKN